MNDPEIPQTESREGMRRREFIITTIALSAAISLTTQGHAAMNKQATPTGGSRPIDTINAYYTAYASGDLEALRAMYAPDIVWRIPGQHPLSGDKHGPDEVFAFFEQLAKSGFQAETIVLTEAGEWVIDLHRGFSTTGTGSLDTLWALAFRVVGGQIVEAINFAFDQALANNFFWANYPLKPLPDRLAE